MNAPTKVTEGGQITLPQNVLDMLGVGPGSEVTFRRAIDGSVNIVKAGAFVQPETPLNPGRFRELRGHAGPGMTTDELMLLLRGDPE